MPKKLFDLENKWLRFIAKITLFTITFSFVYAIVFSIGWSETYDYDKKTLSHPEKGCYAAGDQYVIFIKCNNENLTWLETILSIPFYIIIGIVTLPFFFIYGFWQLVAGGTDIEPLITLVSFLATCLIIYLAILALLYLISLTKKFFTIFKRQESAK